MNKKLKVGIAGASGYAGEELIKILSKHPKVDITCLAAKIEKPCKISQMFPYLEGWLDLVCDDYDSQVLVNACDLVFLALPHKVSMDFVPALIKAGKKVIDLSADYRFLDISLYEKWYELEHKDRKNAKGAIYGLVEINRDKIKNANLIANPGCYPTAATLGLAPILKKKDFKFERVVVDAKSGYSGAGRIFDKDFLQKNILSNFKAYKVEGHRHSPEIEEQLSLLGNRKISACFVPHLLPVERGILETIYVSGFRPQTTSFKLLDLYKEFYKGEAFIKVLDEGKFPELKDIQNTNFCHIGVGTNQDNIVIVVAIDNLIKGASGQAVQNMNVMYGFDETEGLL